MNDLRHVIRAFDLNAEPSVDDELEQEVEELFERERRSMHEERRQQIEAALPGRNRTRLSRARPDPRPRNNQIATPVEQIVFVVDDDEDEEDEEREQRVRESSEKEETFFECNICIDMARNPVLTCCGHLFCWSCLYQWLHVHSDSMECPVCKGEVEDTDITPIYGRGSDSTDQVTEAESGLRIPPRPRAHRTESARETLLSATSALGFEEVFSRIGVRFDMIRRWPPTQNLAGSFWVNGPSGSVPIRIMIGREQRREELAGGSPFPAAPAQNAVGPQRGAMDFTQGASSGYNSAISEARLIQMQLLRHQAQPSASSLTYISSATDHADERRGLPAYFQGHHPMGGNHIHHHQPLQFHNHPPAGFPDFSQFNAPNLDQPSPDDDDRNSLFTSIEVAEIQSGSQLIVDGFMGRETMGPIAAATSSIRRATDPRASDMNSRVTRATRRRFS